MFPIVKEENKRYDKLLLELMDDHAHEDSVGRQLEDLVSLSPVKCFVRIM